MNNSLLTEIRTRMSRLNHDEINEIVQMVNDHRKVLSSQARGELLYNKPVSFDDRGFRFFGRVVKVNRKNSKVKALREDKLDNGVRPSVWTVPNTMLDHAPTFNAEQMKHTSVPVG